MLTGLLAALHWHLCRTAPAGEGRRRASGQARRRRRLHRQGTSPPATPLEMLGGWIRSPYLARQLYTSTNTTSWEH